MPVYLGHLMLAQFSKECHQRPNRTLDEINAATRDCEERQNDYPRNSNS